MKAKSLLAITMFLCMMSVFSQKLSLDLTFTAINAAAYVQLDSIKVLNRTQGGETILHWPDTALSIEITPGDVLLYIGYSTGFPAGVHDIHMKKQPFQLFQNYPNPVKNQSIISMHLPEKGTVNVIITNLHGLVVNSYTRQLEKGNHSFRLTPGSCNLLFLTALWNGESNSIKILNPEPNSGMGCRLDYIGQHNQEVILKSSTNITTLTMLESGILDTPVSDETSTFEFATNIPCPGTPTVAYEGQVYNTIQIFSQCWLKENLNIGAKIPGTLEMSNNSVIEKYCYNNEEDSCTKYGGLYQWDEMMQYLTIQGGQGICPPGWHVPADEEWKLLEGAVDSQYGIGDQEWDDYSYRGFDAGLNLKTTTCWSSGGNGADLFSFSGLPGGFRGDQGNFDGIGYYGYWWPSSAWNSSNPWNRHLDFESPKTYRFYLYLKGNGFSVRCLRD
jgi:uncharacterized protein (TIGR02145 family)